jgi:hypothetical protein
MARSLPAGIHGIVILLATASLPVLAGEKPTTEKQKIEALIKHVKGLKNAAFVRNDKEYDAASAAKFLRAKWEANEADVQTAEEFVGKVATASSTSGKPYSIRFKDGREVKSGDYLRSELKKLEKQPPERQAP